MALALIAATPSSTKQRKLTTKFQCVQKSLASVVLQMPRFTHPDDLLAQLHWLLAASQLSYRVQDCSHHVESVKIWSTLLSCFLVDPPAASSCYEIRRSMSSSSAHAKQSNLILRFSLCYSINLKLITI